MILQKRTIKITVARIIIPSLLITLFSGDVIYASAKAYKEPEREDNQQGSGLQQQQQQEQSNNQTTQQQITIPQGAATRGAVENYYIPEQAAVPTNSNVTWINEDTVSHTATARDGSFDTGLFSGGASASVKVTGQGNIPYYCIIHPWMTASLAVR